MKKSIIYNLSPFNNSMEMSATEYMIKKSLAFILTYCLSAVLGEGIIIGILYGMGYDPLHGVMPVGLIGELLPYYGFMIFGLISFIFSILILWRSNIWIACGLHSIWNFILYGFMGLSLSGNKSILKGVILFNVKDLNILNGAEYGIEASIITTMVLGMSLLIIVKRWKGRIDKNGI